MRDDDRRQLLRSFAADGALRVEDEPTIELSSGKKSRFYVNGKRPLLLPSVRKIVGEVIFDLVRTLGIEAVGGLELGAIPIALAVSTAAFERAHLDLPAFIVRKTPKGHGLKAMIEGDIEGRKRVLIVDDVITSGKSTVEAIEKCEAKGLTVVRVVAIVDRQEEGGREKIEAKVPFEALFTLQDLLAEKEHIAETEALDERRAVAAHS